MSVNRNCWTGKYWNGNKRLISDISWSCIVFFLLKFVVIVIMPFIEISYETSHPNVLEFTAKTLMTQKIMSLESLPGKILELVSGAIELFFLIFFWSWNRDHLKCGLAKNVVTVFFWFFALCGFILLLIGMYNDSPPNLFLFGYYGLVAKKYFKLMGKKEEEKSRRELDPSK